MPLVSTPLTARWITRFICCGNEDSWSAWDTWEEADGQRTMWNESGGGDDELLYGHGHERVAIVYQAQEAQIRGHQSRYKPLPVPASGQDHSGGESSG